MKHSDSEEEFHCYKVEEASTSRKGKRKLISKDIQLAKSPKQHSVEESGDELTDAENLDNACIGHMRENFLTATPSAEDLKPSRILKLMNRLKSQSNETTFISQMDFNKPANAFLEKKLKLINGNTDFFLQFGYVAAPNICVCFNGAGVYINGEWDSLNDKSINEKRYSASINEITPKHRVVILAPSSNFWWHRESKDLFNAAFSKVIKDIRYLENKKIIKQRFRAYGLDFNTCLNELQAKFGTKIKTLQNGSVQPAQFAIRLSTTRNFQCRIITPAYLINSKGKTVKAEWSSFQPPLRTHVICCVQLKGFKLTKTGLSLDIYATQVVHRPADPEGVKSNILEPFKREQAHMTKVNQGMN